MMGYLCSVDGVSHYSERCTSESSQSAPASAVDGVSASPLVSRASSASLSDSSMRVLTPAFTIRPWRSVALEGVELHGHSKHVLLAITR